MGFLNTAHLRFLFDGLLWTVGLSLLAFLGGGLLGFGVALASAYGPRWSRLLVSLYIKLIQGTPLLVRCRWPISACQPWVWRWRL